MTKSRIALRLAACCLFLAAGFARAAEPTREQRLKTMPDEDRIWLTDFVAPIILPEEERVFLQLTDAAEREGFKEDFWRRRETPGLPLPLGPGYRDRYGDLRKVLDAKFIGWKSDAGRLILRRGEPDSILKPQCGAEEVFRDLEIWTYGSLELNGHAAARHIFYRSAPGAPRRLWIIHDGNGAPFQANACRTSFDQLSRDCTASREDRCVRCEDRCVVYGVWAEILKRQGSPAGALEEQGELLGYPKISTAGLDRPKAKWAAASQPANAPAAAVSTPVPTPTAVRPPTVTQPQPQPQSQPKATTTLPPAAPPLPLTPTATRAPTAAPATVTAALPTPTITLPPTATLPPAPTLTRPPTVAPPTPPPTAAPRPAAAAVPVPVPVPVPVVVPSPRSTPVPQPEPTRSPVPVLAPAPTRPTPVPTSAPTRPPASTAAPRPTATVAPASASTPVSGGLRRLSPKEIQDRIETLEPEYKEFVDLARPLLTEDELSRFLQLSGHDKDAFMRAFWKRNS